MSRFTARVAVAFLVCTAGCYVQTSSQPTRPTVLLPQPPSQAHIVHASAPPAPEVQAPMVALGRLRVPRHTQLDQVISFEGRTMSLRDAILEADPNEAQQLRSGRALTLQQVIDALDAWEKQGNIRLSSLKLRSTVPLPTQNMLVASHQQLTADVIQRRELAATGWQAIINRPAGSARTFIPSSTRLPTGQPVISGPASNGAPVMGSTSPHSLVGSAGPTHGPRKVHAATHPYDEVWTRTWGDPRAVGAFVSASAGNEFQLDDHTGASAGCVGVAQLGVWLFGQSREIARLYAGATITQQRVMQGTAQVYLIGDAVPVWHEEASSSLLKKELAYNTPSVDAPVASIGPVAVDVTLSGTGVAMMQGAISSHPGAGHDFECDVTLTPQTKAIGTGGAKVVPIAAVNGALKILLGEIAAGADVDLTLLSVQVPARLSLGVHVDPQTGELVDLYQDSSLAFAADILQGKLFAFLDLNLKGWFGKIVAHIFFDGQTRQHWQWDIHDWPGEHVQIDLAKARNRIALVP